MPCHRKSITYHSHSRFFLIDIVFAPFLLFNAIGLHDEAYGPSTILFHWEQLHKNNLSSSPSPVNFICPFGRLFSSRASLNIHPSMEYINNKLYLLQSASELKIAVIIANFKPRDCILKKSYLQSTKTKPFSRPWGNLESSWCAKLHHQT